MTLQNQNKLKLNTGGTGQSFKIFEKIKFLRILQLFSSPKLNAV